MKLHPEDMSSILSSHGLSSNDTRDDNSDSKQQLQLDQSDNIDGKYKTYFLLFFQNLRIFNTPLVCFPNQKKKNKKTRNK